MTTNNHLPLCVDLDGTLIYSDMLHESVLGMLKTSPVSLLHMPGWLLQGKAALKQQVAAATNFNPATLPYNQPFLAWLREQRSKGRRLVLCTAADKRIADSIAEHLALFDEVMASEGGINLAGSHKAAALLSRFGEKGFDYAGNSRADCAVWEHAHKAVVVNASSSVLQHVETLVEVERIFAGQGKSIVVWRRALRMHQWLKNALLFIPLIAAHRIVELDAWMTLLLGFIAFSLCASSVYIANDLLDLESDRHHPRKCLRPFASGTLPMWQGCIAAPLLLLASVAIAWHVGTSLLFWLSGYFLLTCLYSLKLKQLALIDCLTLALLYTLRILSGAAVVSMSLSFWLLAFSGFLFLSLSFVKRFAELQLQLQHNKQKAHGRGYYSSDAPLLQILGVASGFSAVLVLAMYLNSKEVLLLYRHPEWIWGTVPVMLFWLSWMWLRAARGEMHDDPLVFAVKDKASLCAGVIFALLLLAGSTGGMA